MKTYTKFTAMVAEVSVPPVPAAAPTHTQSVEGFNRSLRWTKDNIYLRVNGVTKAVIPVCEVWALAEANDHTCKMPEPKKTK